MDMTKDVLKKQCKADGLYGTPSINDKIYLHYKGFRKIENLEEYTGLKAIWLEGNGLDKIEGLEKLVCLRTLYLHENLITKMEGLETLEDLDSINLSKNFVQKIEGMEKCLKITNLNFANNNLKTAESIENVLKLPMLQTLDIQHNKIDDEAVVDILEKVPDLRVVYLQGNPVVKKIPHYRKTLIFKLKQLKYLDDRPVFDDERRRCEAWYRAFLEGGVSAAQAAERAEIDAIRDEKKAADERNFRAMEEMMREGLEIRKQREEAQAAASAAAAIKNGEEPPAIPPTASVFSGNEVVHVPESDEVREAREAYYTKLTKGGASSTRGEVPPLPPASDGAEMGIMMPPPAPTEDDLLREREIDMTLQKMAALSTEDDLEGLD
jgi:hypothetical protein